MDSVVRCFVANFVRFSAVQNFWKSVKIWQSYRQFKGGNFFFWDTVSKQQRQRDKAGYAKS